MGNKGGREDSPETVEFLKCFEDQCGLQNRPVQSLELLSRQLKHFVLEGEVCHLGLMDDEVQAEEAETLMRSADLVIPPSLTTLYVQKIALAFLSRMFYNCSVMDEKNPVRARLCSFLAAQAFQLYASWLMSVRLVENNYSPDTTPPSVVEKLTKDAKTLLKKGLRTFQYSKKNDPNFKSGLQQQISFMNNNDTSDIFPGDGKVKSFWMNLTELIRTSNNSFRDPVVSPEGKILPFDPCSALKAFLSPLLVIGEGSALLANQFYANLYAPLSFGCKPTKYEVHRVRKSLNTTRGREHLETDLEVNIKKSSEAFNGILQKYYAMISNCGRNVLVPRVFADKWFETEGEEQCLQKALDFLQDLDRDEERYNPAFIMLSHFSMSKKTRDWLGGNIPTLAITNAHDGSKFILDDIDVSLRFSKIEASLAASMKNGANKG